MSAEEGSTDPSIDGSDAAIDGSRSVPSVYRRRPFALLVTAWGLVAALLWTAFPTAFVVAFLVVGGPTIPLFATVWVLAIGAIFGLAGVPVILHGLDRMRFAVGDPVLLKVGSDGLWLRDSGSIPWSGIARLGTGQVDIIRQKGTYSSGDYRLDVVPADRSLLARRPWFATMNLGLRGLLRRLKPIGDRSRLLGGFEFDLDLLDADPRAVLEEISHYRAIDSTRTHRS